MEDKKKSPELRFAGFTEDWEEKKFENIFRGIRNNSLSRDKLNYKYGQAQNIHYGDILVKFGEIVDVQKQQLPFITKDEDAENLRGSELINGDVILADAAEDETVGKCIEIQNINSEVIHSGLHTIAVRPIQKFAPKYLGYYMNSSSYHDQLTRLMQGTKVLSISKTAIQDTEIRYPPTEEEQGKISEYITELDELIAKHQKKHNRLVSLKKSMLEKMFPKEDQAVPEIRFSGFEGDWEEIELNKVCWFQEGPGLRHWQFTTSGIKVINVTNLVNGVLNLKKTDRHISLLEFQKMYKHFEIQEADIVVASSGNSYGKVSVVRSCDLPLMMNTSVIRFKPLSNLDYKYLLTFLTSEYFKNQIDLLITGGAQPNFGPVHLNEVKLNTPPTKNEQSKIGNYFQTLEELISNHKNQLQKLKNFKQSLSEKMFV